MRETTGSFAGIPVVRTTLATAADDVLKTARSRVRPTAFRLVNSYTFALADQMRPYHHLLRDRGVNLPDGKPLVQSLNVLVPGAGFKQVRGPSLFEECLERGRVHEVRHFFLGGTEELLATLIDEAGRRFPGVQICGTYSPAFRELTPQEVDEQDRCIAAADPDIVWVGLGTPKQDFEAQRITDRLGVTTAGVGAAFAFLAGTQREAPDWMRTLSVEWLFRLGNEPRRLWRRYLFGNTRFAYLVLNARLGPRQSAPVPARPQP